MDVKKLALLVGALVIAVVTAIMAKNMFTGASAPQAALPLGLRFQVGPKVLVAKKALPWARSSMPTASAISPGRRS